MSTKIYNGFRFTSANLNKVYHNVQELRNKIQPLAERMVRRYVVQASVSQHDSWAHFGRPGHCDPSFLSNITRDLWERQAKVQKTQQRDPEVDFSLELAILPIQRTMLGIFYTEQSCFEQILRRCNWFKDYGYWDISDRPDNVSEHAWELRRRDWETAVGDDPVSKWSLNAEIVPVEFSMPIRPRDMCMQQSIDSRATHLATEHLFKEWRFREMEEIVDRHAFSVLRQFKELIAEGGAMHQEYLDTVAGFTGKLRKLTFKDITCNS